MTYIIIRIHFVFSLVFAYFTRLVLYAQTQDVQLSDGQIPVPDCD